MDIHTLLQNNCVKLLEQYNSNLDSVLSLQATLIDDILPGVEVELDLDTEGLRWAKEWLEDTCERLCIRPSQALLKYICESLSL
jgi:hypothetical protein